MSMTAQVQTSENEMTWGRDPGKNMSLPRRWEEVTFGNWLINSSVEQSIFLRSSVSISQGNLNTENDSKEVDKVSFRDQWRFIL
jgi:hypothetical protein